LKPVLAINSAHMVMLVKQQVVKRDLGTQCLRGLQEIPEDLQLDPALEDIHMNVEAALANRIGVEAGGQLNLAKSRNDQVATAIRMALRNYLLEIVFSLAKLRATILDRANEHIDTLMPGYTHLQHGQPTSLAHHLLGHHDALQRGCRRIEETYSRVNRCPLGSVALASTGVNIDRGLTSMLLGFDGLVENSIDAVSSRDFAVESISDLAMVMTDLSRIAEELVLWSSSEFGVVEISDDYASTSSVMPQKKNAVVAELIRGKTSTVYGDLVAALSLTKALPYSYNIDLQQMTPHIWSSCEITLSSILVLTGMLAKATFDRARLRELLDEGAVAATDLADYLAVQRAIPFRTAHNIVGNLVRRSAEEKRSFRDVIIKELAKTVRDIAGLDIAISSEEVDRILDPKWSVATRSAEGGPSSLTVKKMMENGKKDVKESEKWVFERRSMLEAAESQLKEAVEDLTGGESA
jgi:argininosuccinate lyase